MESFMQEHQLNRDDFWGMAKGSDRKGSMGCFILPWFMEELTPPSQRPQYYAFGMEELGNGYKVKALLESMCFAIRRHGSKHWDEDLTVVGKQNLLPFVQMLCEVLGCDVHWVEHEVLEDLDLKTLASKPSLKIQSNPLVHSYYGDRLDVYGQYEDFVLSGRGQPDVGRAQLIKRWAKGCP
jgi:hypothetical protein